MDQRYCLVGPYIPDKAATDFEASEPPPPFAEALAVLRRQGVKGYFGHWLVAGKPQVILLEFDLTRERLNSVKHTMWEVCGVQSPSESALVDNALAFGEVSALLVGAVFTATAGHASPESRVLAHFHEWQGGVAIGLLKRRALPVATLFTTHATLLGRYIASGGDDLYQRLPFYNAEERAKHFGILAQHQIERACAQNCTVFTTVSPITGEECQYLLGRKPDVITPNGINTERYDVGHDFQTHHATYKESIRRFVMGHFFPSYAFDLDKTLFFFTSGRFEPHNKGFDLCLEALARLNVELKAQQVDVTVVFFVVTSQPTRSLNPHAMRDRGVLDELQEVSNRMAEQFARQLFLTGASNTESSFDEMIDEYWRVRYRRTRYALRSIGCRSPRPTFWSTRKTTKFCVTFRASGYSTPRTIPSRSCTTRSSSTRSTRCGASNTSSSCVVVISVSFRVPTNPWVTPRSSACVWACPQSPATCRVLGVTWRTCTQTTIDTVSPCWDAATRTTTRVRKSSPNVYSRSAVSIGDNVLRCATRWKRTRTRSTGASWVGRIIGRIDVP